jgi:hypothetical protein
LQYCFCDRFPNKIKRCPVKVDTVLSDYEHFDCCSSAEIADYLFSGTETKKGNLRKVFIQPSSNIAPSEF